jgi:hypothetical protein
MPFLQSKKAKAFFKNEKSEAFRKSKSSLFLAKKFFLFLCKASPYNFSDPSFSYPPLGGKQSNPLRLHL